MKKEFKIGDRVAVYQQGMRAVGRIYDMISAETFKIKCDDGEAFGYPIVHPKQCRRLIKRKRREWWILRCKCSAPLVYAIQPTEYCPDCGDAQVIHVREVKARK